MKRITREEILAKLFDQMGWAKGMAQGHDLYIMTFGNFRDQVIRSGILSSPTVIRTKWEAVKGLPFVTPYLPDASVDAIRVNLPAVAAYLTDLGYITHTSHTYDTHIKSHDAHTPTPAEWIVHEEAAQ